MKLELRLQSAGVAVLLVYVLRFAPEADAFCEKGWTDFNNNCYKYVATKATYPEALGLCIREGYYLVEINSDSESSFIANFLKANNSTRVWMGVNDLVIEGRWVFSTQGTPVNFTKWGQNQPDNTNNEDCGEFISTAEWNDRKCNSRLDFVCEGHEPEY